MSCLTIISPDAYHKYMKHFLSVTMLCLVMFACMPLAVFASAFQLKTVGSLNVDGVTYGQLWYTSGDVTFSGITLPGTAVTATIDGVSGDAGVDEEGNWYYSANLSEGDHQVSFFSEAGSVNLTLTIGDLPEGVGGALPVSETPTAGNPLPTVVFISAGSLLLLAPLYLRRNRSSHRIEE
jgi:hypothetical protein